MAADSPLDRLVSLEDERWERDAARARDAVRLEWYARRYGRPGDDRPLAVRVKSLIDDHAQRKLRVDCGSAVEAFEKCIFGSSRAGCLHRWEPLSNCMRAHDLEYVRDAKDGRVSLRALNFRLRDIPKYIVSASHDAPFDPSTPADVRALPPTFNPLEREKEE
uniref:Uncharacterized protein n=1 Tax=Bicosoecida sp. CB-2014 TaxID=1486930 RepID=A0A7S1C488_9STRA